MARPDEINAALGERLCSKEGHSRGRGKVDGQERRVLGQIDVNVCLKNGEIGAAGIEESFPAAVDNSLINSGVAAATSGSGAENTAAGFGEGAVGGHNLDAEPGASITAVLDNVCIKINKGPSGRRKPKNRSRALSKRSQGRQGEVPNFFQGTGTHQCQNGTVLEQQTIEQVWDRAAPIPQDTLEDLSYLQPWGDSLVERAAETTLRVVYQNVAHSFAAIGEDPGISSFTENVAALGAGMAMCSETNVNWKSVHNTLRVRRILQKSFRVHMSTNSSGVGTTPEALSRRKLPGGLSIFTFDHWSATVIEQGQDKGEKGWFCYTTLLGKNNKKFTSICFYRSCRATASSGASSAHSQASTLMDADRIDGTLPVNSFITPREAAVKELCEFILEKIADGHSILLAGDGNETPEECMTKKGVRLYSMEWLFQETGLEDVCYQRHGARPSTTTTTNGRFIDWVGVWQVPVLSVARLGEHFPAMSDHLAFVVDIDIATLFGGKYSVMSGPQFRKLSVKNRKARKTYEEYILQQWREHRLYERAVDIHRIAKQGPFLERDYVTLDRLDTQASEILLGGEKKCSNKVLSRDPWSPLLKQHGKAIVYWRARLYSKSHGTEGRRSLRRLQRQAGISDELHHSDLTKKAIKARLRAAWRDHREARKVAASWRDEHLSSCADDMMERMQVDKERAIKMVRQHEASKRRFGRIRRAMGKSKKGLTQITVTDPESGVNRVLTTKEEIDEALLRRNEKHFQEPNETPFGTQGRFHSMVAPGDQGNQVEEMLSGTASFPGDIDIDPVTQQWLEGLQRKNFSEIDISISPADFVYGMKGVKESTASSPSGRHVGHYITIARMDSEVVRATLCLIAETALLTQRPLDRWLHCTQVMLEKGKGNHIDNLRIIQLLEADLNFVLRLIWGRRLNRAAHGQGLYNKAQYAVPGSLCNSAVLQKVLFADMLRQTNQCGAITEFDVKAAYDRVIPALATVTCMRLGLPREACEFMTYLIGNMEYKIGTATGVSEKSFRACANQDSPGQGTMQGSGSSPTIFLGVTDVSLSTQEVVATPAVFRHPDPAVDPVVSYAVQFVDDNGQECSEQGLGVHFAEQYEACRSDDDRVKLLVHAVNENASSWSRLQWIYGGVFNASKCYWYLIKSTQCPKTGAITYARAAELPADLIISHPEGKEAPAVARRYEASEANRTLGVQWAPDGNVKKEMLVGAEKIRRWAGSLRRAQLSNDDRWVAYTSCVKPALMYPQVPQRCDAEDLSEIQKEVDRLVCHALGLNEHFPRALLNGPVEYGGMGVPTLWAEALADKTVYFLHHIRRQDEVGRQLALSMALTQVELGTGVPFLELQHNEWGHLVTPSWVVHLWKSCSRVGVMLRSAMGEHWVPPLQTESDRYIMDVVTASFSKKNSIKINYCRRYLQVVTLSDLMLHDGSRLHPDVMRCRPIAGRKARYNWPSLPAPPSSCVRVWKRFLSLCFPHQVVEEIAEDDWAATAEYSHDLEYYFHPATGDLYREDLEGLVCYPSVSRRANRHRLGVCSRRGELVEGPPPEGGCWVEVERVGTSIVILCQSLRAEQAMRCHARMVAQDEQDGASFSERLANLPEYVKALIGTVSVPQDEGRSLVARWEAGQPVYGVSDGSAKQEQGLATHAWKLCSGPDDPMAIIGAGPVDGRAPTPARAEAQGQLSVLIVSTLLAQSGGLHRSKVLSICDNTAVLRRLSAQHRMDRLQAHESSDADLYLLYKTWLLKEGVQCKHQWEKGHQDRHRRVEDLSDIARINVEVDRLAGEAYSRPDCDRQVLDIPVFPEERYAVFTEDGKILSEVRPAVIRQCGAAELREYQMRRHQMSLGKYEGIDWDGLHSFLRRKPPTRRSLYVKYHNGWLPTQAFLFQQKRSDNALCPLCGVESETLEHLYQCGCKSMNDCRYDELKRVVHYLRLAGTATEILNCWTAQLSAMFGMQFVPYYIHDTKQHREIEAAVARARKHQAMLSWNGFLQGRWSKEWRKVQALSERLYGRQFGSARQKPWIARAMELICEMVPTMWRTRNETVHGRTMAERAQKERERVIERVRRLYSNPPVLLPRYAAIQAVPLAERLQKPTLVLQLWIRQIAKQVQVSELVRQHSEERQRSIEPFLVRRRAALAEPSGGFAVFDRGR